MNKEIKKNIRTSVFETNSSSSHSISLNEDNILIDITLIPDEEGIIRLIGGEFGWEWERYNDAITKANYASIETSGANREFLINAIKEQTGAKEVILLASLDYDATNYSYIDHESTGLLNQIDTIEKMKNWLFNPNTWLITGNDNSSEPINIFDFPTYKKDGGYEPYKYKYKLKIEGIDTEVMLGEDLTKERLIESIEYLTEDIYVTKESKIPYSDLPWHLQNDEKYFKFRRYEVEEYIDFVDVENKTITAFNNTKLAKDINQLIAIEEAKKFERKIINEKKSKEEPLSKWMIQSKMEKQLKENCIENYIMKINYELIEINKDVKKV
jgi:hypothetical protein